MHHSEIVHIFKYAYIYLYIHIYFFYICKHNNENLYIHSNEYKHFRILFKVVHTLTFCTTAQISLPVSDNSRPSSLDSYCTPWHSEFSDNSGPVFRDHQKYTVRVYVLTIHNTIYQTSWPTSRTSISLTLHKKWKHCTKCENTVTKHLRPLCHHLWKCAKFARTFGHVTRYSGSPEIHTLFLANVR